MMVGMAASRLLNGVSSEPPMLKASIMGPRLNTELNHTKAALVALLGLW